MPGQPLAPSPNTLAAVIVVRDEAKDLAECLAGLRGVVDEIVVYDGGSTDDTAAVARAAGATVIDGYWDDDFGRARNAALDAAQAEWLLIVDADERIPAYPRPDREALLALLAATDADVLTVMVRNVMPEEFGGSYRHPGARLLRRGAVRYQGRVHEQPVAHRGGPHGVCPPEVLSLDHLGYADPDVVRAKARRNARIAQAELTRLRQLPSAEAGAVAKTLLDLGRSLVIMGRQQAAVDAFEEVRAVAPGSRRALEATDALARLLLGAGMDDAVVVLAEQLRDGGVDPRYCDWLAAQALAQLGHPHEALRLLGGIDALRDSAGRELDQGQVVEMRALVAALVGDRSEAASALADAMVRYGRIAGRGAFLLQVWGERPMSELSDLLRARLEQAQADGVLPPERTAQLTDELASCGPHDDRAETSNASSPPAPVQAR